MKNKALVFGYMVILTMISCADFATLSEDGLISQKDSISLWLKKAEKAPPPEPKTRLLQKAYTATLSLPNDTLKTIYYTALSYAYKTFSTKATFIKINTEAVALALNIKDSLRLAECYWDRASYFSTIAYKKDSAYYYYYRAQQLYERLHHPFNTARMLINMAIQQIDVMEYTGSERNLLQAIHLLTPLKKYEQLANCYNNLGIIARELEKYTDAIKCYRTALTYVKKANAYHDYEAMLLNNIGNVYEHKYQYALALKYYREAQRANRKYARNPELKVRLIQNIANIKLIQGDTEELPELFYKAYAIEDSLNLVMTMSSNRIYLTEYYTYINDTAKALNYALEARVLALATKNYKDLLNALLWLSKLEKGKKSTAYLNQYIHLNDSLQQQARKLKNQYALVHLETETVALESKTIHRQLRWIISILAGISILGILWVRYRTRKTRKTTFIR